MAQPVGPGNLCAAGECWGPVARSGCISDGQHVTPTGMAAASEERFGTPSLIRPPMARPHHPEALEGDAAFQARNLDPELVTHTERRQGSARLQQSFSGWTE